MRRHILFATLALGATAGISSADNVIFYNSSFEGEDGGWVGTGDWERGTPSSYDPNDANLPSSSSFGNGGIPNAADGSELWATNLDGPHSNAASGQRFISTLSQTFDFSSFSGDLQLGFQHYLDSGSNSFDQAQVVVNGNVEMLYDGAEGAYDDTTNTVTFENAVIDLTAYAGQSDVEIVFNFDASTVVARDGWYIDDVQITAAVIPEPTSIAMLGLAGVGLLSRRRR